MSSFDAPREMQYLAECQAITDERHLQKQAEIAYRKILLQQLQKEEQQQEKQLRLEESKIRNLIEAKRLQCAHEAMMKQQGKLMDKKDRKIRTHDVVAMQPFW